MRMTKSRTHRIFWRKTPAVLMLALLLLLYWCIPVTVSAEEVIDSGASAVVSDGADSGQPAGGTSGGSAPASVGTDSPVVSDGDGSSQPAAGAAGASVPAASEGADSSANPEPVDVDTVLTPPPGSAEIVEVEETGQDTNQLENVTTGEDPIETEFANDPASITVTETFENQPGTDTTIAPDLVADETNVVVTETQQPITENQQPIAESA